MELIPWLVAAYAVICVAAYFGHRLFMYWPDPTRVAPAAVGLDGVKEIEIAVADGVTLIAWYAPAKDNKPTVLYFHGHAANAANRATKIETMRQRRSFWLRRADSALAWWHTPASANRPPEKSVRPPFPAPKTPCKRQFRAGQPHGGRNMNWLESKQPEFDRRVETYVCPLYRLTKYPLIGDLNPAQSLAVPLEWAKQTPPRRGRAMQLRFCSTCSLLMSVELDPSAPSIELCVH